jgi:hypothetical protein
MPRRKIKKPERVDFHKIHYAKFEEAIKKHPKEAVDFCLSKARDAGRQSDSEMSEYWKERAKKIRESYLK